MKNIVVGLIIIVVLAVLAIGQRTPKDTAQNLPSIPTFMLADVAYFEINMKNLPRIHAKQENSKWVLVNDDLTLNDLAVDQLLHDLQTMKVKRVVTKKTELFQRFGVDENEVVLKDKAGKIIFAVFVGSPATDLVSTYIRLSDENRVLTVDKVLTWQVKRTQDGWLEKKDDALE
ncbi:MAG: DUF4340 domain-containing protein [Ghiorsea sp.]